MSRDFVTARFVSRFAAALADGRRNQAAQGSQDFEEVSRRKR